MNKKGIQIPFTIIIFIIIILILVALLLIWNFSGVELLNNIFSSAGNTVQEKSAGVVDTLI